MEIPEVGDYLRDKETNQAAKVFKITDTEIVVIYLVSNEKITYSKYDFWDIFDKIEYYEADDGLSGRALGVFLIMSMCLAILYTIIIWIVLHA